MCMVTVDYAAFAQTDTCYMEGAGQFGVNCGASSVNEFVLCGRNDHTDINGAYLNNVVDLAEVRRCPQSSPPASLALSSVSIPEPMRTKRTILALKTNILYDAATVLNFSIEGVINQNFSILYEQHCPWWETGNNRYCLQILTFGGEFRRWFRPTTAKYASRTDWVKRDALVGHLLGLYGFGGKFDVQAKRKGCYQGEIMSVGLTYGYAMPICKRLNLEFSVSVGYANIPYRHYIPTDDYEWLIRDRNKRGRTHYVGPTKVEVALVVPILATFKGEGGRR